MIAAAKYALTSLPKVRIRMNATPATAQTIFLSLDLIPESLDFLVL